MAIPTTKGFDPRGNFAAAVKSLVQTKRAWMEGIEMTHYIAIFIEDHVGEWRVVFPDVPGCEAKGFSLDDAQVAAASTLSQRLRENGTPPPLPMDLTTVEKSQEWLEQNRVDLSKAVVSMISFAA